MVLQSPIYKAPSISKMGKKSSPLNSSTQKIESAVKSPKLKSSKMSFAKGLGESFIKPESLKGPDTSEVEGLSSIASTLTETNSILVEIQKQLELDFSSRIAERKQKLADSKKDIRKKKLSAKESFVEKGKGLLKPIKEFSQKALQPIRSIFDKILDFLALVGVGFVVNNLWGFLKDEKNREKIVEIFAFLKTYWKEILVAIVGIKLINSIVGFIGFGTLLYKIGAKLVSVAWRILTGGKKPGAPPGTKPTPPGTTKPSTPSSKSGTLQSASRGRPVAPRTGAGTILGPGGKPIMGSGIDAYKGGTGAKAPTFPKPGQGIPKPGGGLKLPPGLGRAGGILSRFGPLLSKALAPLLVLDGILTAKEIVNPNDNIITNLMDLGTLTGNALQSDPFRRTLTEPRGDISTMAEGSSEFISWKRNDKKNRRILAERKVADSERYLREKATVIKKYPSTARFYDNPDPLNKFNLKPPGYSEGGSIFKRVKGTVGGTGSGDKDTVKALLAPGEEVVRSSAANLFRPLLKDINDNAGRMWTSFTTAIRKQDENNILQEEVNKKFEDTLKLFNEEITKILNERKQKKLDELAEKLRAAGGGSGSGRGGPMRVEPAPVIKPKTKTPSKSIQTYRRGRGGGSTPSGNSEGTGNVTVLNNTQPMLNLANQSPEPIETESTEKSQVTITISSTDDSNPYIMNSYVNYGIDV